MKYKSNWPFYTDTMINKVTDILKSGKVNQWTGHYVKEFEEEFAKYFGMKHAIAVSNGTVSLEMILRCLNIGKDDEVIVTPRSFIASANQVALVGATPVFADVSLETQNLTAESIKEQITSKTRAVILVHLAGIPCDMDPIIELCQSHNIDIIEDCAQTHGSKYKGQYVGTFGRVSSWSFCQDKIISTGGEGGMLLTNDTELYKKLWSYKDHGKDYDFYHNSSVKTEGYQYTCTSLGSNYRMTEISAVIGIESLKLLEDWKKLRGKNVSILNNKLSSLNNIYLAPFDDDYCIYKYYIHMKDAYIAYLYRDTIIKELQNKGIQASQGACGKLYDELCLQKYKQNPMINSEELMNNSIMIPIDPSFDETTITEIANHIYIVLNNMLYN